jgi:hypothetical protein
MNCIEWFKTTKEYGQLRWTDTDAQIFEHNGIEYSLMCVSTAYQTFEYLKVSRKGKNEFLSYPNAIIKVQKYRQPYNRPI